MERQQFTQHLAALNCFASVDLNINYENAIHTLECIHNTLQTLQFINEEHLLEMRERLDCDSSSEVSPIYRPYSPMEIPEEDDVVSEYSTAAKLRAYNNLSNNNNNTSKYFEQEEEDASVHDGMPSFIRADDSSYDDSMPSLVTASSDYYIEVIDDAVTRGGKMSISELDTAYIMDNSHFIPIRPPTIIDLTHDECNSASDWNRSHGVPSTNALNELVHYTEHYTIPPELEYGYGDILECGDSHQIHPNVTVRKPQPIHPNVTVRRSKRIANK
jgi:hypothetical protein